MGGKRLLLLVILLFAVFDLSNTRHLLLQPRVYPSGSYEIDEEEFMKDKFQLHDFEILPSEVEENIRVVPPTVGFAEASPDILLERLIDEADDYFDVENVAQKGVVEPSIMMDEPKEDINSDLDETL